MTSRATLATNDERQGAVRRRTLARLDGVFALMPITGAFFPMLVSGYSLGFMHGVLGRRCPESGARHPPGAHGRGLAAAGWRIGGRRWASIAVAVVSPAPVVTWRRPAVRHRLPEVLDVAEAVQAAEEPAQTVEPAPSDVGHGSTLSRRSTQGESRTVMMARPDSCRGSRAHRLCPWVLSTTSVFLEQNDRAKLSQTQNTRASTGSSLGFGQTALTSA
jgi:hypothetical protein